MNGTPNYVLAWLHLDPAADGFADSPSAENYAALRSLNPTVKPVPSKAELDAAWANYVPPLQWNRKQLMALFTRRERQMIRAASVGTPAADAFDALEMRDDSEPIRSDSLTLAGFLTALVMTQILTPDRPAQIRAGIVQEG